MTQPIKVIVQKTYKSTSLLSVIFVLLLALKLAEIGQVATWSWWWVTSPIWAPAALVLGVAALFGVFVLVLKIIDEFASLNRWKKF